MNANTEDGVLVWEKNKKDFQRTFAFSESTIETVEKGVKYFQS